MPKTDTPFVDLPINMPDFSSGYKQGLLLPKEGSYSATDFENDSDVISSFELVTDYLAADRGPGSLILDQATIGKQTDMLEFMRDDVARLGAPITKAHILKDAPEEVKAGYRLLQQRFDMAELSSPGEWASAVGDYTVDTIFNPEILVSVGALLGAVPTGGGSVAARAAVGLATKQGAKAVLRNAIRASRAASQRNPHKTSALVAGLYGGVGSIVAQSLDVGIGNKEEISVEEVVAGVAIAAPIGIGVGLVLQPVSRKVLKYFQDGTPSDIDIPVSPELYDEYGEALGDDIWPATLAEKIVAEAKRLTDQKAENPNIGMDSKLIESFVDSLGGGENTQAEVRAAIRAAIKEEKTAAGVTNRVKETLYKASSKLAVPHWLGKPAGVLSPYTSSSASAKILQGKLSYEIATGWKKSTKLVEKDLSEVQKEVTGRYNERFRVIVEHLSLNTLKGNLSDDINDLLMVAVRNNKKTANKNGLDTDLNKYINTAAKEIKQLYRDMGVRLHEIGVIDELVENYIPRMWDRKAVEANPKKLAALLESKGGFAKGTGKQAVEDMLGIKDKIDSAGAGGHFFSAKRKINNIENDADFQEFLNTDVLGSLHAYTYQAGKSIAKHRVLGVNSLKDFHKVWTRRISKELAAEGKNLTSAQEKEIDLLYMTATGEGMERWGKKVDTAMEVYGFVNRIALLPLATISSLTEVFINISRAGFKNSSKGLFEAMEISFKGITKDLEKKLITNHKLTTKEAFSEMRKFSINMDQALAQTGNRLAGDDLTNDWMQDKSNKFFRLTFLDQWTKFVQTVSFASGKNLIYENLEALATNGTRKLDRRLESMAGELAELDINYEQGIKWFKDGAKTTDAFYDQKVLFGAARYADSVILQPSAMSGLRPLLFSNPKTTVAFHLLGYPAAYTNTVLKGAAKSIIKDPIRNTAKVLNAAILMTGVARWTNYVRSNGENEKGKTQATILKEALARWGANGLLLDSFSRARTSAMYSKGLLPYFGIPFGTMGTDISKLLTQGVIPLVGGKVPFVSGSYFGSQIDEELVKDYRQGLRDAQKELRKQLISKKPSSPPRFGHAKGGEVTVPNAPAEPDERIDKMTGQPYNLQAGSAFMDETDPLKVLMSKGGTVSREKYNVGRVVSGIITKNIPPNFISNTAASISEGVENLFNPQTINKTADRIDSSVAEVLDGTDIDAEDIILQEYIDAVTTSYFSRTEPLPINELEKISEWRTAVQNTDKSLENEVWGNFQVVAGMTDNERLALQTVRDLQEEYDPSGAVELSILDRLRSLENDFKRVRVEISQEEIAKVNLAQYDTKALENTEEFIRTVTEAETTSLSDEGLETVVENSLVKLIASGDVDLSKFNTPDLNLTGGIYPNTVPNTKTVEEHISQSIEPRAVFRAVVSFGEASTDISFAHPREIGAHVGTEGQATTILVKSLPDTQSKQNLKELIESGAATRKEVNESFADLELITGDSVPEINDFTEIVDDIPLDNISSYGSLADVDEPFKPMTMYKGYIDVRNPLFIDSDLGSWEAERVLEHGGSFEEYFRPEIGRRGIKLNPSQERTLKSLQDRADDFPLDAYPLRTRKVFESIKSKLQRAELNIDFRTFLEDLGFDSIMYRNEAEMSYIGGNPWSYILFKPDQFKVASGKLAPIKPVKEIYSEGGLVTLRMDEDDPLRVLNMAAGGRIKRTKGGKETEDPSMYRQDGTRKSNTGYLGQVIRDDGAVMTEYSIGVEIDGEEVEMPSLVPTLTEDEIEFLRTKEEGTPIPKSIVIKAKDHALPLLEAGESPFYQDPDPQERDSKDKGGEVYKIESGDTLSALARKYGTTVDQLAADNDIDDVNMIYAGKSLKVPTPGEVESQTLAPAAPPVNTPARTEVSPPSSASLLGSAPTSTPVSDIQSRADNTENVRELLEEGGLRPAAVAGVLGNIDVETGGSFDHLQQAEGDENSIGLFQLNDGGGKQSAYFEYLSDERDTAETQIAFMLDTIYGDGQDIIGRTNARRLRNIFEEGDAEDIATAFSKIWEVPRIPHLERRTSSARAFAEEKTTKASQAQELAAVGYGKTIAALQRLAEA